jgi:transaldolase
MILQAENKEEMITWIDRLYNPENEPGENLVRGVTTNPPLSYAAIQDDPEYWKGWIAEQAKENGAMDVEDMFWQTYLEIVRRGAKEHAAMFEESGGKYGYISGQVDPRSKQNAAEMVKQGLEIAAVAPNVMVKVPGTKEGYEAIKELSAHGISTNNTLSMTIPQFKVCMDSVADGVKEAKEKGIDLSKFRSVITAMSGRFGTLGYLEKEAKELGIDLNEEDIRWAEVEVFKKACKMVTEHPEYDGKMLLCSTKLSPEVDGKVRCWHIEKAAGENVVYTCPPSFIAALMVKTPYLKFEDDTGNDIPSEVLEKLIKIPYFVKGYSEDGYTPEEFNTHPAVAETGRQHMAVTDDMVNFVRDALAVCGGLKN